jgi:hypothetical protein
VSRTSHAPPHDRPDVRMSSDAMAGFNSMPALSSGATPGGPDSMAMTASDMEAFNNACMAFDESML